MATPKFLNVQGSVFYSELKNRVNKYFEDSRKSVTGNFGLYFKAVLFWTAYVALYVHVIFFYPPTWLGIIECVLMGGLTAAIGFNVMHDGGHGSFSKSKFWNKIAAFSVNALGASGIMWNNKHNIIHHTYTNVDGMDDDIAKSPIIRQCESQKWVPAHKVQHLYLLPIYSLSTIFWIFIMDFKKYFSHKIYTTDAWKMSAKNHIIFWVTKVLYLVFYVALPISVWGFLPWLAGYMALNAVMGLTLSIVFQLAHVVENTEFEHVPLDETKHIETAWAEHQVKTTANFAMGNKVISWFVGGLNFQIEHHLFPRVSHIHYPAISKIVMQKCKEYNLPYNKYDTLHEAVASHFRMMKFLGKKPEVILQQVKAA